MPLILRLFHSTLFTKNLRSRQEFSELRQSLRNFSVSCFEAAKIASAIFFHLSKPVCASALGSLNTSPQVCL